MEEKILSTNIDASAVEKQFEEENKVTTTVRKTEFNEKNYLQARLKQGETKKSLTIRLLPFSPEGGSPFKKVFIHTVKVSKELSPGGWRTFVCPTHNEMGDRCPFCEVSSRANEYRRTTQDEVEKKKYGDIEFLNKAKAAWIVRCIERGHEDDGVKFWLFNDAKSKKGVYDNILNIYKERKASAERRGKTTNIFDLNEGKDLIVTLTKDENGKTVTNVVDDDEKTPLSDNFEQGMAWINDTKKWNEVYTVKPYEYMSIVINGGIPVYSKEQGKYVDLNEKKEEDKKIEEEQIKANLTEQKKDFSTMENNAKDIVKNKVIVDGDDLPF